MLSKINAVDAEDHGQQECANQAILDIENTLELQRNCYTYAITV